MRHKVLLAAALVALMATPAFAAVQNVKVSGSIDSTYLNRNHFNFGRKVSGLSSIETTGLIHQSVFITQTTLRVDADLSDNVSTTVGLINERDWGSENAGVTNTNASNQNTEVDIYLAYTTMREFLYSPLTVSIGRQYFGYGNGLIIGENGVNHSANGRLGSVAHDLTKRTTYDGVKATLDYKPLTIDLLYFKNNQANVTGGLINGVSASKSSSDVYGINTNYQLGDSYNTVVEAYWFVRNNQKGNLGTVRVDKPDTLYIPGLRVSTNPIKGLNTQAELAWQRGNKAITNTAAAAPLGGDNVSRNAMAAQLMASYTLPVLEQYKPVVNASYTHVSGDKNAFDHRAVSGAFGSSNNYSAWDPLNENQGSGTIYNTLFNLSNLNIFSAGVQATPIQDVTASVLWSGLFLDKKISASNPLNLTTGTLIQPDGSVTLGALDTTSSKSLGNEWDVNVNYNYTEDVTFGVSLGWFIPGTTFDGVNDSTASQALAHVLVNF